MDAVHAAVPCQVTVEETVLILVLDIVCVGDHFSILNYREFCFLFAANRRLGSRRLHVTLVIVN